MLGAAPGTQGTWSQSPEQHGCGCRSPTLCRMRWDGGSHRWKMLWGAQGRSAVMWGPGETLLSMEQVGMSRWQRAAASCTSPKCSTPRASLVSRPHLSLHHPLPFLPSLRHLALTSAQKPFPSHPSALCHRGYTLPLPQCRGALLDLPPFSCNPLFSPNPFSIQKGKLGVQEQVTGSSPGRGACRSVLGLALAGSQGTLLPPRCGVWCWGESPVAPLPPLGTRLVVHPKIFLRAVEEHSRNMNYVGFFSHYLFAFNNPLGRSE